MATLDNVEAGLAGRVRWSIAEGARQGLVLVVTEGYRDYDEQVRIFRARYQTTPIKNVTPVVWNGVRYYKKPGMSTAAIPGKSDHGRKPATAVDLACANPTPENIAKHLAIITKAGLRRTVAGEYWHVQTAPGAAALPPFPLPSQKEASSMIRNPAVEVVGAPSGAGYYILASDGAVFAYGDAVFRGGRGGDDVENAPFVTMKLTPSGEGYWLVGADGGIFAYGDAKFFGSMGGKALNAPIVSFDATASGQGYVMLGEDGGIFAFGDAQYVGNAVSELV